jgi:nucleotide-binding universal stress UspA family protein
MYKNILIASDGSELAGKAIEHGVTLAKSLGAKVTGVTVTTPFDAYMTSEVAIAVDATVFEQRTAAAAKKSLDAIAAKAQQAGVECTTVRSKLDPVYEGIIDAAQKQKCDLIIMASHGRRGLTGLILGSETTKVLTHSTIPVLVVR